MIAKLATPWLIVPRKRPSFVIIKQITLTHTYNIAGTDGNVMVPVLPETGSLIAHLLHATPPGIAQGSHFCMAIAGQYLGNIWAIPRQYLYHKNALAVPVSQLFPHY